MKIVVLDGKVMKEIIEGENDVILNKLEKIQNQTFVTTTLSSFLNAILSCKPNVVLRNVQKLMKIVKIQNDETDYKNPQKVNEKIVDFIKLSRGI